MRSPLSRVVSACSALSLLACGAGPAPTATTVASAREPTPAPAEEPSTPIELVQRLEAIARGEREGSLDDYVDHAFARRLPSSDDLRDLFVGGPPEGCTPALSEDSGYGAIAIPPPMDDDGEEEAARIEAIIRDLQASTEVIASCHVHETIEGEEVDRELFLYAIAVHRDEDGALRAMAWRNMQDERTHD